jgi:hypothetical protein
MRKPLFTLFALFALVALVLPLQAESTASWTGWITDSHCAAKGASAKHSKDCVERCAKSEGGKVVFFNNADQKLYDLDKTDLALEHVGHEVKITGTLDGQKIAVSAIEATQN